MRAPTVGDVDCVSNVLVSVVSLVDLAVLFIAERVFFYFKSGGSAKVQAMRQKYPLFIFQPR